MFSMTAPTMDKIYAALVEAVDEAGIKVETRGHKCKELRPACFTIDDARQALYRGQSRKMNYRFFAVETLQYLAGHGDEKWHAELLLAANSNMKGFRNQDTEMFDGAYGPRLRQSMFSICSKLRDDPWSRQCYASIWEPEMHDILHGTKDLPCTMGLHFYRGGPGRHLGNKPRLCCTGSMRSNDLNWGTPYDVGAFAAIQCAVAGCLGWDVGEYNHSAGSLHTYDATPPSVTPEYAEAFHPAIGLPDLTRWASKDGMFWGIISVAAGHLLQGLYVHVCEQQKPWDEFESEYFEHSSEIAGYWSHWCTLLRWSWKKNGMAG